MQWVSSRNSVKNKQPTVLAILEILIAFGLYYGLVQYFFDSWLPYVVACFIAPLILLRTEQSTELGIKLIGNNKVKQYITGSNRLYNTLFNQKLFIGSLVFVLLAAVVLLLVDSLIYFDHYLRGELTTAFYLYLSAHAVVKWSVLFFVSLFVLKLLNLKRIDKVVGRFLHSRIVTVATYLIAIPFVFVTAYRLMYMFFHSEVMEDKFIIRIYFYLLELSPLLPLLCILMVVVAMTSILINVSIFVSVPIKIYSTVITFLKRPIYSLQTVPNNWFASLCIDVYTPPEIIPGLEKVISKKSSHDLNYLTFDHLIQKIRALKNTVGGDKADYIFYTISALTLFLPAYIYRLSLKATLLVWFPLLWLATIAKNSDPLPLRLQKNNESPFGRFVIYMSLLVVLLFILKLIVFHFLDSLKVSLEALPVFAYQLVQPYRIPLWQLASVVNAVIAIGLYAWGGHSLIEHKYRQITVEQQSAIANKIRVIALIRGLLTLYTSACLLYIVAQQVPTWSLPPIDTVLFPWAAP